MVRCLCGDEGLRAEREGRLGAECMSTGSQQDLGRKKRVPTKGI